MEDCDSPFAFLQTGFAAVPYADSFSVPDRSPIDRTRRPCWSQSALSNLQGIDRDSFGEPVDDCDVRKTQGKETSGRCPCEASKGNAQISTTEKGSAEAVAI
jgi:hypothetical protein